MPCGTVKVRLLDAPFFLDRDYDYLVPEPLCGEAKPGRFVTVPFGGGNRRRTGLVVGFSDVPPETPALKPIDTWTTPRISLTEEMLGLVCFLREQTLCTTGDAVRAMIPAGALSGLSERYRRTARPVGDPRRLTMTEVALLARIEASGECGAESLRARFGAETETALKHLVRLGLLQVELSLRAGREERETVLFSSALSAEEVDELLTGKRRTPRLGERQRAGLRLLQAGEQTAEALREVGCAKAQTDALLRAGLVTRRTERRRAEDMPPVDASAAKDDLPLDGEQQAAYDEIERLLADGAPHAALLHGVTGSGKTRVMLRAIDRVLQNGRGAIVLLPEIALTPQTLAVFCSRYGRRVAVMHSALSAAERLEAYYRVLDGEADVVVGTRSAVFAPVKRLGLIVLDEEHEHTYKSDMNPKYHARDAARFRCAKNGALLLLASATPSLESYRRAREGRYTLLELKHRRAGAVLPDVTVADMRAEPGGGGLSPLGGVLTEALTETLRAGDQAILFLNRRGYHHVISCRSCGTALTCPACSVTLTYHTDAGRYDRGRLVCHLCGRRLPLPEVCPSCGSPHLARLGYGTQRVEEELGALAPGARVLRMDADTTGSRQSYEEMLGAFRRREADILLGTQMVTKGHDFPGVTLVGVLMADASLYLDDYRAGERTFAMLTQVIGRAGRAGKRGRAIIQTANPDHEIIRLACAQDYAAFYEREIRLRRLLVFPPFCDIVLLTLSHTAEQPLLAASGTLAEELAARLRGEYADVPTVVFGPFEAPVYRVEGRYRMRMVIKCRLGRRARALFAELLDFFDRQKPGTPRLSVDFNPSDL